MTTITNKLSTDDLLIQLAEDASELAKAATRYYRVMHGTNPSPLTLADTRYALIEEIADVNVAAEALRLKLGIIADEIVDAENGKYERWIRRLNDD